MVFAAFNLTTRAGYEPTLEQALDTAHRRAKHRELAPGTQAVVYSRQANGFVVLSRDVADVMLETQAKAVERLSALGLEHEPELELVLSAII